MSHTPDPAHMRRAVELATANVLARTGGPFAAVIVCDGKVVAEAANTVTTTMDPTAHGEINAIRKACAALGEFSLAGCEIYSSCEPCPMCLAAIYWARLEAIYYGCDQKDAARAGFDDAVLYEEIAKGKDIRSIPSQQLLQSEAWETFGTWIAMPMKVEY